MASAEAQWVSSRLLQSGGEIIDLHPRGPGIVSFARAESRASKALQAPEAKDGISELEELLESAISVLFDGEVKSHIRANVM
jgi:hypothetical protein